jgi:hypothetical protein
MLGKWACLSCILRDSPVRKFCEEEDRTPDFRISSAILGYSRFLAPACPKSVPPVAIALTAHACDSSDHFLSR